MKRFLCFFKLSCLFLFSVLCGTVAAQRNLIEVPSSEIVERKKLFVQVQSAFSPEDINTMALATYGFGKEFEVGVVLNQFDFQRSKGLEIDPDTPEKSPDFLINAQKGFTINQCMNIGIGLRSGINAADNKEDIHFITFNYINTRFKVGEKGHQLIGGAYYANRDYEGEGTRFGVMVGADLVLIEDRLHFISDFISGTSSLSVINTGLEIELPGDWKITLGAQFPDPGTDNEYAGILQISWN